MDPRPVPLADPAGARLDADAVESELAAVEEALRRLDDGTYDRCERCGAAIADELLAASPAVRRCAACSMPGQLPL